jgi:hypothetical protein
MEPSAAHLTPLPIVGQTDSKLRVSWDEKQVKLNRKG